MSAKSVSRYLFIDLLRFAAAVLMVQGHVFDALLSPLEKARPYYYLHDVAHGFVPPLFFFLAGAAFSISTVRRWDVYHAWSEPTRRRILRFLGLIAIGYALHLPFFSLRKILSSATPAEWAAFLEVDATQCIGVTLLLLQAVVMVGRRPSTLGLFAGAGAVFTIAATPAAWAWNAGSDLPVWFGSFLSPKTGSWFPFFPAAAFILAGAAFGYVVTATSDAARLRSIMRAAAIGGGVLLALGVLSIVLPIHALPPPRLIEGDLRVQMLRFAWAIGISSALFLVERRITVPTRIPLILGRESLFIYIAHLVVVYGSVLAPGLNQRLGPTLTIPQGIGVFVLVGTAVAVAAWGWHELHARYRRVAAGLTLAGVASFLYAFMTRPW